jgi:hypothetical protein
VPPSPSFFRVASWTVSWFEEFPFHIRFEGFTVVNTRITVFWDVVACGLVISTIERCRGTNVAHIKSNRNADNISWILFYSCFLH